LTLRSISNDVNICLVRNQCLFLICACLFGRTADAADVTEIITQARTALGGADRLFNIRSLSLSGTALKRATLITIFPSQEVSMRRDFKMDFLLPESFLRRDSGPPLIFEGLSDGKPWNNRHGDNSKLFATFRRWLLVLRLSAPGVGFSWAGEARTATGKADILLASGTDGFEARLLLDQQSHLPLMIIFKTKVSPELASTRTREEESRISPSEYATYEGIRFPQVLTRAIGDREMERLEVKKYIVNPPLTPRDFRPR
jgi:hypothetical protein